jgi:hypothetical protein
MAGGLTRIVGLFVASWQCCPWVSSVDRALLDTTLVRVLLLQENKVLDPYLVGDFDPPFKSSNFECVTAVMLSSTGLGSVLLSMMHLTDVSVETEFALLLKDHNLISIKTKIPMCRFSHQYVSKTYPYHVWSLVINLRCGCPSHSM